MNKQKKPKKTKKMEKSFEKFLERQSEKIHNMLKNVFTLLVTCRQFGDTGKGKFVDVFAHLWADIIARGTGGPNAGHTSIVDDEELITHTIPSGILHDCEGKVNVLTRDVVIDPRLFFGELAELDKRKISYNHLMVSLNAHVITPMEIALDRIKESASGKGKIGSTCRGIGPCYTDFHDRQGIIMNDLINPDIFLKKLKKQAEYKKMIIQNYDPEMVAKIMNHEDSGLGFFYDWKEIFDINAIYEQYIKYGADLKYLLYDTETFIKNSIGKKKILGEGSQGDLLSIDRGTYPYVTSSDCTAFGLAKSMGIHIGQVDLSLGILKFPYMTRVGGGPFPSEMGGIFSDDWCNGGESNREKEKVMYAGTTINEKNDYLRGFKVREAGDEFGATTGRPRRTGDFDLPLLRYVMTFNSPDIAFTKLDVYNSVESIKICTEYVYQGPTVFYGQKAIFKGEIIKTAIMDCDILRQCKPVYKVFPGWMCSLKDCSNYESLPEKLRNIIQFVVQETGIRPRIISVGRDREETIFL